MLDFLHDAPSAPVTRKGALMGQALPVRVRVQARWFRDAGTSEAPFRKGENVVREAAYGSLDFAVLLHHWQKLASLAEAASVLSDVGGDDLIRRLGPGDTEIGDLDTADRGLGIRAG